MESRLFDASRTGSVDVLMELLRSDPIIVRRVGLVDGDSPLHLACLGGHFNFVKELLKLRKELAGELNQNGFSCLHIAAANGDLHIVKEILKVDIGLCLVKGRERRIPLHCAVIKGRVDVMKELLSACVESVEVVTSRGETVLHLAVKSGQFEALEVLIKHIKMFNKTEVFNKQDELGNSVLHLAAARKQHEIFQVVDLLLNGSLPANWAVGVNSLNKMGFTALDVLFLFQSEAGDREIEDILRRAGALKATDMVGIPIRSCNQICASNRQHGEVMPRRKTKSGWLVDFLKYDKDRDSIESIREVLVVIMMLTAMLTFQAALNPPGNLQQQQQPNYQIEADHLIHYSSHIFLFFNSLGFFISLHVFHIVTREFPMRVELVFCVFAIGITYISCLMIKLPTYFCYYLCVGIPFILVFSLNISRSADYLHPHKITSANLSLVNQP
ncbi:ankyrin repeat-containing protein BDA1-like isoform X1 [Solanum verrucosum]|uniref:ankyrin repeat-containing protein BDA1-like isoform X1 n=1 Tax=Solanum verrucosum TaxID=315347 RepID=UPI0020D0D65F|nr:ankyrin repeat-containing protein BDA1-like isoform X1 [Solanum verrucosum]